MLIGSAAKTKILECFVRRTDFDKITEYCEGNTEIFSTSKRRYAYAVSFREAGEETLKCLNRGAGAKGHDILEKSIKAKSMGSNIGKIPDSIRGLIGHWELISDADDPLNGAGKSLTGIYITRLFAETYGYGEGKKYITLKKTAGADEITVGEFINKIKSASGVAAVVTKETKLENIQLLATFVEDIFQGEGRGEKLVKGIENIYQCFYTGDYDLHDIIFFETNDAKPLGEGKLYSHADFAIIKGLNAKIKENPAYGRRKTTEFNVVRHGPQCSYYYYAKNHAGQNLGVGLLRADLPIAVCNKGIWCVLENDDDLADFYIANTTVRADAVWVLGKSLEKITAEDFLEERLEDWIIVKKLHTTRENPTAEELEKANKDIVKALTNEIKETLKLPLKEELERT